jgi:hypothetical protein
MVASAGETSAVSPDLGAYMNESCPKGVRDLGRSGSTRTSIDRLCSQDSAVTLVKNNTLVASLRHKRDGLQVSCRALFQYGHDAHARHISLEGSSAQEAVCNVLANVICVGRSVTSLRVDRGIVLSTTKSKHMLCLVLLSSLRWLLVTRSVSVEPRELACTVCRSDGVGLCPERTNPEIVE